MFHQQLVSNCFLRKSEATNQRVTGSFGERAEPYCCCGGYIRGNPRRWAPVPRFEKQFVQRKGRKNRWEAGQLRADIGCRRNLQPFQVNITEIDDSIRWRYQQRHRQHRGRKLATGSIAHLPPRAAHSGTVPGDLV